MATRNMLSVGIDVGTTTTQLVLSDLAITNQHRLGLVPRLDIDTREVRYQGDAHFTPLLAADEVDVDKLTALIRHEYTLAGVEPGEVETGAVIITGETARTRNAEQILHGLGDLAGDFVVTVAGPNLESQIAGRGSGAAQWSAANYASVVNVDVGGGSSNAALLPALTSAVWLASAAPSCRDASTTSASPLAASPSSSSSVTRLMASTGFPMVRSAMPAGETSDGRSLVTTPTTAIFRPAFSTMAYSSSGAATVVVPLS